MQLWRLVPAVLVAASAVVFHSGVLALGERQANGNVSLSPLVVQYAPSAENFPNPERGFYHQLSPFNLGALLATRSTPHR